MQDLLSMDLVEAFVVVATRGSVTEAAQVLHRSQPAISQRVKQLEEELDLSLFQRRGRTLVLTDEGKRLLKYVQPLLVQWRAIPEQMKSTEVIEGTVTIGAFATTVRYLLADPLVQIMQTHPDVKCVVQTGLSTGLFQQLREGTIDVLYLIGDMDIQGFDVLHLRDIPLRVVYSKRMWPHPTPPTTEFLQTQRLVLWRGASDPSFAMVERHARALGWVNEHTFEVPHIETLKAFAQSGHCFVLLPDYVVDFERDGLLSTPFQGFDKTFPLRRYTVENRYLRHATRSAMALIETAILDQPNPTSHDR